MHEHHTLPRRTIRLSSGTNPTALWGLSRGKLRKEEAAEGDAASAAATTGNDISLAINPAANMLLYLNTMHYIAANGKW